MTQSKGDRHEPPFLVRYTHRGEQWSFTIWATSWEDAEQRLRAIADNAAVIGSSAHTIPSGPAVRLVSETNQSEIGNDTE
jgi:hypothetical protein